MNSQGDVSLISVESVTEMLCVTREGAGPCPHPAVTLGAAEGTWVVVGEVLQEKLNKNVRNGS